MINITYIRLLNAIESFSSAHGQIKRFAADFPEQMPNFATEDEKFPILFVSPDSSIFMENANKFVLKFYCFDIIEKGRGNINSITSDTNTILNDVYRWFKDGDIFGIDVIEEEPNSIPINNALLDYAAGWEMTLTFVVDTYGICEIPFNEPPVVITEVCDIVYSQYLTCETLGNCSTFLERKLKFTELVSGVCNGVNTVFEFAQTPDFVYYNGQLLMPNRYTTVGTTITLDFAPFADDFIFAQATY